VVISRAQPAPRMVLRPGAQPLAQGRIGISHRRTRQLSSLHCSVLPGHPAGEPLAHPHHRDEVSNGRPPAFRAQKFPGRSPSTRPSPAPRQRAAA
jgi:hypothetical protein